MRFFDGIIQKEVFFTLFHETERLKKTKGFIRFFV